MFTGTDDPSLNPSRLSCSLTSRLILPLPPLLPIHTFDGVTSSRLSITVAYFITPSEAFSLCEMLYLSQGARISQGMPGRVMAASPLLHPRLCEEMREEVRGHLAQGAQWQRRAYVQGEANR